MDDVISRQAAIDVIDKIFPADPMRSDYTQGITCGAALATEYIKQLPSAQPEVLACGEGELMAQPNIIRCKDCKYWGKRGLCDKWDNYISNGDFYCGCAERRTDESD